MKIHLEIPLEVSTPFTLLFTLGIPLITLSDCSWDKALNFSLIFLQGFT